MKPVASPAGSVISGPAAEAGGTARTDSPTSSPTALTRAADAKNGGFPSDRCHLAYFSATEGRSCRFVECAACARNVSAMLRHRAAQFAFGCLVAVVLAGGCSFNKESSTTDTTTDVVTGTSTSSTASSSATTEPDKMASPEEAATHLFTAWKAGNKTSARKFATAAAVDTIFSHPFNGSEPVLMGCEFETDHFTCNYFYEGGAMHFRVQGGASVGWTVSKVTYTAD